MVAKYEIQETLNFSHNTKKFVARQMVLLHNKLITQGEKYKTSTQNLQRTNVAWQDESFGSLQSWCLKWWQLLSGLTPGGDSHMKQTGMVVRNFEFNP